MPLQGFGDTGGDRASAHSQGTAGQTQLLRGGKAIFSFLYIYIYLRIKKAPLTTNQISCFELLLQAADWQLIARHQA